jgi:hypothetical protein
MVRVRGRIKPKTKERFQKRIRDVVKGLSRPVLVYKQPLKSECPNCFYDKLTDSSTGKCKWTPVEALEKQVEWEVSGFSSIKYKYFLKGRCPVCKGLGYIETIRRTYADCLVIWNPSEGAQTNDIVYTPAGAEGSTIVMLKTHPKYFDLFKNADKLFVDGIECKISRPPILRGLGNQSVLIITAFTTEKPKVDSDEIIKDYR